MSVSPRTRKRPDHRDEPTYWFALLEIARERGDFAAAAEAQAELKRLGGVVLHGRPEVRQAVAR